ncbi:MAG TPA: metallophosphoesterase [Tepidisphaeraceae bacterium]|nr:metallophosphoesterase [Tepidisphaeraceae bacterium]
MRILVTADLHYNHGKSRRLAEELIDRINTLSFDVLLLIGDTASSDGDALERCLARFEFAGPRLFVAGNHELWTSGDDSYRLFRQELPARIRAAGWHWLEGAPFVRDEVAIVGSVGWYDYSFAQEQLGIPRRFYEQKISPGAAERLDKYAHLLEAAEDIPPHAREVCARWNDGQYVKLHRSDEAFLEELLGDLGRQLESLRGIPRIIAAIHHLPFAALLPPSHNAQWDFAKAYLGAGRMGELLLKFGAVGTVFCGHSHFAAEAVVGGVRAVNVGSGYREKRWLMVEVGAEGEVGVERSDSG